MSVNHGTETDPLPLKYFRGQTPPKFAHAAERECAEILEYYGVPWQYEPITFILEMDEDGRVQEAFSPDFFLPNENLFIEITTMRQELVTRKNRKVRKLKKQYPDVTVKLFYRKDIEALAMQLHARTPTDTASDPFSFQDAMKRHSDGSVQ